MTEKVIFETEVKTGASADSVKSLKSEMRSLVNELGKLEPGSAAFVTSAKRAGELQDKIEDTKNAVAAFNPEKKFQAFAGVIGGVANGFSALQGATALFGAENKDIEKIILKTQGAMALATGITGLMGMKDAFSLLGTVIKTQVVAAFGTMKAALISTGIGAFVVLLGGAISKITDYNDAIDAETNFQEKYNEVLKLTNQLLQDQADKKDIIRNAKRGGLDDLTRELKLLQAKGATEKEIFDKQQQIAQSELYNLKVRLATVYKDGHTEVAIKKEIADKSNAVESNRLAFETAQRKKNLLANIEINSAKTSMLFDSRAKELKLEEDAFKAKQVVAGKDKKQLEIIEAQHRASLKHINDEWDKKDNDRYNRLADKKFENYLQDRDLQNKFAQARQNQIDEDLKFSEFQINLAKEERDARLSTMEAIAGGLQTLSGVVFENTRDGKHLAAAAALIDTYVGANKALAQGGAFGFISAAAVTIAGLANVRRILITPLQPPKGATGGGGGSAPQISPPAGSNTTRLVNGNEPIVTRTLDVKNQKVYVLETDITGTQKRVSGIQNKARVR